MPSDILRDQEAASPDFGALATAAGPVQTPPVIKTTTPDYDAGAALQQTKLNRDAALEASKAAALEEQAVREKAAQSSAAATAQAQTTIQGEKPRLDAALAETQQAQQAYQTQAAPPSRQLTDFLQPVAGESPENTISKLIHGISLIATGWTGLARGDATAALASLSGALKGWHEGDKVRADRAFADWKAKSDKLLADWEMRHKTTQEIMANSKLTIDNQLKLVELTRTASGDAVGAAVAKTGNAEAVVKHLTEDRKFYWEVVKDAQHMELQKEIADLKSQLGEKVLTPQRIQAALAERGWFPGDAEYNTHYLNAAKQTGVEGLGVVGAAQLIPQNPNRPQGAMPGQVPRGGQPSAVTPLVPATPKPGDTTHYIDKETLQPPPANLGLPQIQQSGKYVAVAPSQLPKFQQMRTAGSMLDSMEQIIRKRPDIWPVKPEDVPNARMNYWALTSQLSPKYRTDPEIGTIESNKIALPNMVKAFGDVGNIAGYERQVSEVATGFGPAMRDEALARIENIRNLLNQGLEPSGVTFRFKGGGKEKKVIRMPSGLTLEVD